MVGEGHERRSKQCQETGGSGSSRGPSAHPKKLAKRARPNTLQEESSPEDSPPHCGTPESPNELECLKIRSAVAHTNREVVNYSKEDPLAAPSLFASALDGEEDLSAEDWLFIGYSNL
jgi:hypothetical protein